MVAIMPRVGSGSVIAESLPRPGRWDELGLAAIRPSRFYESDETVRSWLSILRVTSAGLSAIAACRLARAVHPPDLVECLAPADRRHPGARQTNRHGGAAYSRAGAGDRLPDLPWRPEPSRVVIPCGRGVAAATAGRQLPRPGRHRGDWHRRYHRAAL